MTHPLKDAAAELPDKPGIYFFKNAARRDDLYRQGPLPGRPGQVVFPALGRPQGPEHPGRNDPARLSPDGIGAGSGLSGKQFRPAISSRNSTSASRTTKAFPTSASRFRTPVPGIFFSRKVAADGARYFGPFSPAREARKTIQLLTKSFRLRTCEEAVFRGRKRPCLEYDLGTVSAPCVGRITAGEYRPPSGTPSSSWKAGRRNWPPSLGERMDAAAADERFEDAARCPRSAPDDRTDPDPAEDDLRPPGKPGHHRSGPGRAGSGDSRLSHAGGQGPRIRGIRPEDGGPGFRAETCSGNSSDEFYCDRPLPEKILVPVLPAEAAALRAGWSEAAGRRVALLVPRSGATAGRSSNGRQKTPKSSSAGRPADRPRSRS